MRTAAEAVRSALNQSRACLRQRAREPGSDGESPGPGSVPANAAARAAWNRFAVVRSAASSGDDVKDSAHRRAAAACWCLAKASRANDTPSSGVDRELASFQDRRKPCLQSHQVPGARRQIARAQKWVGWRRAGVDARQGIERFLIIARLDEGTSQEKVRRGETGVEADGLAEFSDGVLDATGRLQGVGECLVGNRKSREPAHRLILFLEPPRSTRHSRNRRGRSGRGPSSRPASAASPHRIRRPLRAALPERGVPKPKAT